MINAYLCRSVIVIGKKYYIRNYKWISMDTLECRKWTMMDEWIKTARFKTYDVILVYFINISLRHIILYMYC